MATIIDHSFVDDMTAAYLECAEWSSLHYAGEDADPVPMDSLGLEWSADAVAAARETCQSFAEANARDMLETGADAAQHGHDLWLTAAGHGAGFWDRGYGAVGERLTAAARPYVADAYVSGGQLHLS